MHWKATTRTANRASVQVQSCRARRRLCILCTRFTGAGLGCAKALPSEQEPCPHDNLHSHMRTSTTTTCKTQRHTQTHVRARPFTPRRTPRARNPTHAHSPADGCPPWQCACLPAAAAPGHLFHAWTQVCRSRRTRHCLRAPAAPAPPLPTERGCYLRTFVERLLDSLMSSTNVCSIA